MAVAKKRAVLVAEIVGGVGVLWTLIGAWQQTEQLVEDWPRVVRWIGSPRSGVVVVIVALVVYAWLQLRKEW